MSPFHTRTAFLFSKISNEIAPNRAKHININKKEKYYLKESNIATSSDTTRNYHSTFVSSNQVINKTKYIMEEERKINTELETEVILKLIKGGLYQPSKKETRINHFWVFCHSTFWSTQNFSEKEVEKFKALIAEHFKDNEKVNHKFKELVERATMAKRYIKRRWWRYITKPMDW